MKYFFFLLLLPVLHAQAQQTQSFKREGRSIFFSNKKGDRLRLTPYGNYIIRVQAVQKDNSFYPDNRYEMVESHQWPGILNIVEQPTAYRLQPENTKGISMQVEKNTWLLSFYGGEENFPLVKEKKLISWSTDTVRTSFVIDPLEHFAGLGHGYYGRGESIDLRGKVVQRNYGTEHGQQAPLIVPYFLSGKGYGIFLNSTFPNTFSFGKDDWYGFSIAKGQMDYFIILGPTFTEMMDRYTRLTGRPRLPPRSFFGLALSDKGHDHNAAEPSDEKWWKQRIIQHRAAGFPLDHVVNDNRWRAGGGQRCLSRFEWDSLRYPNPGEYAGWLKQHGLISTLDFNRCIAVQSAGWKPGFNIPNSEGIDFNTSAPDFTKKEVREWFWNLMWSKSLNPKLAFPGDALWIDEFDEMGKAPLDMKFSNGTTWLEMRNYWFFLIGKALVQEGWIPFFKGAKRPFVWVRGMTAGAQRYATLWSGDIKCTYDDMKSQVIGLQLAGLSGFPFWGHDAGGFYDYELKSGPDDTMYRQWSMAFGSFTPFWKPHGVGQSRWPLDRSDEARQDAKKFSELRYKLIPFIYSYAYQASSSGLPMARAMVLDNQHDSRAWIYDQQYMWGKEFLVAPHCSGTDTQMIIWLPKGNWYNFWNDSLLTGNQVITHTAKVGVLPIFVKAGAIIPMANYRLSTAFINRDSLVLHIYTGSDGLFSLYEDDGVSEAYMANEKRTTTITFSQSSFVLQIAKVTGTFKNANTSRNYRIDFHGLTEPVCFSVNGNKVVSRGDQAKSSIYTVWDFGKKIQSVFIPTFSMKMDLTVQRCR